MSSSTTSTSPAVNAEGAVGSDIGTLAASGAQIAASVSTSNPAGIVIGSVDAANALVGLINNIQVLQKAGSLTATQVASIMQTMNLQTTQADEAWQKATGSAAV
jgi:hypothetical protein